VHLRPTACQATRRSLSFFEIQTGLDARAYTNTTMQPLPILATVPGIEDIQFPSVSRATVIGISVAIAGNVLISLALNLQKLAHARLEKARVERNSGLEDIEEEDSAGEGGALGVNIQHDLDPPSEVEMEARMWNGSPESRPQGPSIETDPLIPFPRSTNAELLHISPTYGALHSADDGHLRGTGGSPLQWKRKTTKRSVVGDAAKYDNRESPRGSKSEGQESEYLRSKLWYVLLSFSQLRGFEAQAFPRWLGFLLMNVGETGNFISYAFAPASVVAPLGTVLAFYLTHMWKGPHSFPVCTYCQLSLCAFTPP
jgi:hypothetical protein